MEDACRAVLINFISLIFSDKVFGISDLKT